MTLETATDILRIIGYILLVSWWLATVLQARAVRKTVIHYRLTTMAIVMTGACVACDIARSMIALIQNDFFGAGGWLVCATLILHVSRKLLDDNNWFNDQFKKLKKFGTRLRNIRITLPSPMPSPA